MYTTQPIPALVLDADYLIIISAYYMLGVEQADPDTTGIRQNPIRKA